MENSSCENCKLLNLELEKKEKIILDLQAEVKNLTKLLAIEKNEKLRKKVSVHCKKTDEEENKLCENEALNLNRLNFCDNLEHSDGIVASETTQTVDEECKESATSFLKTGENEKKDFNKNEVSESGYVYNEEYKMYYSYSTGYYFDQEKGLFLEPNTGTCYRYDYANRHYRSLSINEYMKLYEQLEDTSCEDVVEQVNGLNISEKNAAAGSGLPTSEVTISNEGQQSTLTSKDNKEYNSEVVPTSDWLLPEGKSITMEDLVKEVVEQHCGMSDYMYDEASRMYYCPSTGYYFDPVKQLLYDTSNQISYRYDEETQSYEYFGEWKSEDSLVPGKSGKQRARKKYWRKKLQQKQTAENVSADRKGISEHVKEEFSSPEEGEIFSSSSDVEQPSKDYCPEYDIAHKVFSKAYPPCIRVIVEQSETMRLGSLMIVTHKGGIIGREKDCFLHIPDSCVSKFHAEIKYDDELKKYIINDLGSQNGTFINGKRLSQPKEWSKFRTLNHGDRLSLGSCRLLLHVHPGSETCDGCEPGQVLAELGSTVGSSEKWPISLKSKEQKERERKQELRRIKKKYGLKGGDFITHWCPLVAQGYEDLADYRRRVVGSENPYEKTEEASADVAMPSSNKGYQMLQRLGWREGQTLGAKGSGILEPLPLIVKAGKAGLGCPVELPARNKSFDRKWVKASERFFQAS